MRLKVAGTILFPTRPDLRVQVCVGKTQLMSTLQTRDGPGRPRTAGKPALRSNADVPASVKLPWRVEATALDPQSNRELAVGTTEVFSLPADVEICLRGSLGQPELVAGVALGFCVLRLERIDKQSQVTGQPDDGHDGHDTVAAVDVSQPVPQQSRLSVSSAHHAVALQSHGQRPTPAAPDARQAVPRKQEADNQLFQAGHSHMRDEAPAEVADERLAAQAALSATQKLAQDFQRQLSLELEAEAQQLATQVHEARLSLQALVDERKRLVDRLESVPEYFVEDFAGCSRDELAATYSEALEHYDADHEALTHLQTRLFSLQNELIVLRSAALEHEKLQAEHVRTSKELQALQNTASKAADLQQASAVQRQLLTRLEEHAMASGVVIDKSSLTAGDSCRELEGVYLSLLRSLWAKAKAQDTASSRSSTGAEPGSMQPVAQASTLDALPSAQDVFAGAPDMPEETIQLETLRTQITELESELADLQRGVTVDAEAVMLEMQVASAREEERALQQQLQAMQEEHERNMARLEAQEQVAP